MVCVSAPKAGNLKTQGQPVFQFHVYRERPRPRQNGFLLDSSFLVYSGPQLTKWGPPTLGRATRFATSTDANARSAHSETPSETPPEPCVMSSAAWPSVSVLIKLLVGVLAPHDMILWSVASGDPMVVKPDRRASSTHRKSSRGAQALSEKGMSTGLMQNACRAHITC